MNAAVIGILSVGQHHVVLDCTRPVHGQRDGLSWIARPWLPGSTTWDLMAPLRDKAPRHEEAVAAAADLCAAVADLHAAGWVHGGLRPAHAVHRPDGGVHLLSYGWASGPGCPPSTTHDGGLVHLLAPEAAARLNTGWSAMITQAAEVYTLAAGIWWAATGEWHLDYARVGVDPGACTPSVLCHMRPRIPIRDTIPAHPGLADILLDVLAAPESGRPSARDLAANLRTLL